MKRQAITILFVLLAAGMLTQCRTKNDAKIDNTAVSTPEISVQSTISNHIDSAAAEVKEVAKQVEDTLQRVPDTLQVQPQGEPHKGFVYVRSLIPDLIEDLRYFTTLPNPYDVVFFNSDGIHFFDFWDRWLEVFIQWLPSRPRENEVFG